MIATTAVLAVSVFMTLLAFGLFWRVYKEHSPANYLLMFWLGTICVFVCMLFLIRTRLILEVPWLYRLPSPLYYLTFPAAWIYLRMVVKDETGLRKTDWLHALPALLHLIEMLPFYLSSYSHKLEIVLLDLANPMGAFRHAEGWLPNYVHNIIRAIQTIAYAIPMALLIRNFYSNNKKAAMAFSKTLQWLKTITAGQFAFGFSVLVLLLASQMGTPDSRSYLLYILLGTYCTVWATYLVLNPSILRAMPRLTTLALPEADSHKTLGMGEDQFSNSRASEKVVTVNAEMDPMDSAVEITSMPARIEPPFSEEYAAYSKRLQQFMDEHKPYLEARYSFSRLAMDLQIPRHHLTHLLNQVLHTRFTDYINQQRINHLQNEIAKGALKYHTLEGLALEAGFNSRITFIRAVQRTTGQNPSSFFKAVADFPPKK